ncbi:MAG: hypothetical protein ABI164_01795 [Acidobacteriaceae bacterium]
MSLPISRDDLLNLPLAAIQPAPADRVATESLQSIFPYFGVAMMAFAIMISTFGTVNWRVRESCDCGRPCRPDSQRPYRVWRYPSLPLTCITGASVVLIMLFTFRSAITRPRLAIVATGLPIYAWMRWRKQRQTL